MQGLICTVAPGTEQTSLLHRASAITAAVWLAGKCRGSVLACSLARLLWNLITDHTSIERLAGASFIASTIPRWRCCSAPCLSESGEAADLLAPFPHLAPGACIMSTDQVQCLTWTKSPRRLSILPLVCKRWARLLGQPSTVVWDSVRFDVREVYRWGTAAGRPLSEAGVVSAWFGR